MTVIEDSPLMKEFLEQKQIVWFDEGRQEGLDEGRQEGLDELRLNVQRVLVLRFGITLGHFEEVLKTLSFTAIQQLSQIAFEVETLAQFEETIQLAQAQSTESDKESAQNADSNLLSK